MTILQALSKYRPPGGSTILLIVLLVVGGSVKGSAQTEFSERQYAMYRSFFYESINTINELTGSDKVNQPLEELERLPAESQREICSVVMDYRIFRLVVTEALFKKAFERESTNRLTQRIMFDLAEVEWTPLDEVSLEDQTKVLQASDSLQLFLKESLETMTSNYKFCIGRFLADLMNVDAGFNPYSELTPIYSSVPVEFRLREFYRSQLPFVNWVLENTRESEEKDALREWIESVERKYLLDARSD